MSLDFILKKKSKPQNVLKPRSDKIRLYIKKITLAGRIEGNHRRKCKSRQESTESSIDNGDLEYDSGGSTGGSRIK